MEKAILCHIFVGVPVVNFKKLNLKAKSKLRALLGWPLKVCYAILLTSSNFIGQPQSM